MRGGATRAHGHYMDGLLRDWRGASRDREAIASAALAAGIFHRNEVGIQDVKRNMHGQGLPTRLE